MSEVAAVGQVMLWMMRHGIVTLRSVVLAESPLLFTTCRHRGVVNVPFLVPLTFVCQAVPANGCRLPDRPDPLADIIIHLPVPPEPEIRRWAPTRDVYVHAIFKCSIPIDRTRQQRCNKRLGYYP